MRQLEAENRYMKVFVLNNILSKTDHHPCLGVTSLPEMTTATLPGRLYEAAEAENRYV